jgi:hypothetical protein
VVVLNFCSCNGLPDDDNVTVLLLLRETEDKHHSALMNMSYLKSFFPLQKFNEFIQVDKWVPSERCDVCLQSLSVKAELSKIENLNL